MQWHGLRKRITPASARMTRTVAAELVGTLASQVDLIHSIRHLPWVGQRVVLIVWPVVHCSNFVYLTV